MRTLKPGKHLLVQRILSCLESPSKEWAEQTGRKNHMRPFLTTTKPHNGVHEDQRAHGQKQRERTLHCHTCMRWVQEKQH